MAQIIVSANIVVANGPRFALNQTLEVEAYEEIDITAPAGAATCRRGCRGRQASSFGLNSD